MTALEHLRNLLEAADAAHAASQACAMAERGQALLDAMRVLVDAQNAEADAAVAARAYLASPPEDPSFLATLGERLRTQDNRITAEPIFIVQQRKRIYGLDTQWSDSEDSVAWLFENEEWPADDADRIEAEAYFEEHGEEPDGWTRTGFVDEWVFVTACFTEQGCKDYLAVNGHNLKEPRIYVESGWRNAEWIALRKWLTEAM